uniref:Uncharacterized protein n=1 Tax=Rhizophora mucronata TaxID=61149 RepID=A0A2P2MHY2_RHIMU
MHERSKLGDSVCCRLSFLYMVGTGQECNYSSNALTFDILILIGIRTWL